MKKKRILYKKPNYVPPLEDFLPTDLRQKFIDITNWTSINGHAENFKSLYKYLKRPDYNEEKQCIIQTLTFMFLNVNSTDPIKKTLYRILLTVNSYLIKDSVTSYIKNILISAETLETKQIALNNICNCFDNFKPGFEAVYFISSDIFLFAYKLLQQVIPALSCMENYPVVKRMVYLDCVYKVSKILLILLQKCDTEILSYSTDLANSCFIICSNSDIPFDSKLNYGFILVIVFNKLPVSVTSNFHYKDVAALELLKFNSSELQNVGVADFSEKETVKVVIFAGILNVIPQELLSTYKIHDIPVTLFLFHHLTVSLKNKIKYPSDVIEISRPLIALTQHLTDLPLPSLVYVFKVGINLVRTYAEHHTDGLRHVCKTLYTNLVKIATHHYKLGKAYLLKWIINDVLSTRECCFVRYIAFNVLCNEIGCFYLLKRIKRLPYLLLSTVNNIPIIATEVCSTYELLMEKRFYELQNLDEWTKQWVETILIFLRISTDNSTALYTRLLVFAIKITPYSLVFIKNVQRGSSPKELIGMLACLRMAKKMYSDDFLKSFSLDAGGNELWENLIDFHIVESLMFHQEDEVRVHVLGLIVESHKTTKVFTLQECKFLVIYFRCNIIAQKPNIRKQIVALYKKAITRFFEGAFVINRTCAASPSEKEKRNELESVEWYMKDYYQFVNSLMTDCLLWGIQPGANYMRRSSCLELLLHIKPYLSKKQWNNFWKDTDVMNLNSLLFDSYESNREMAVALLIDFTSERLNIDRSENVTLYLEKCINLATDIKRAANTSSSYMFHIIIMSPHLLNSIRHLGGEIIFEDPSLNLLVFLKKIIFNQLSMFQKDLFVTAQSKSLYGLLSCVRYLFRKINLRKNENEWKQIIKELINVYIEIGYLVCPIVFSPSPEGFLPDNSSGNVDLDESDKAQVFLVFAWKTMSEVTLFFGEVVSTAFQHTNDLSFINKEQLRNITDFFITLFFKTKHRGVFEQAYIGFSKICQVFWSTTDDEFNKKPGLWVGTVIDMLSSKMKRELSIEYSDLCATRRSAGIPFMILAILTTEPFKNNKHFEFCMNALLQVADTSLSNGYQEKAHSMNILRALYKNNELGEIVTPYLSTAIKICIDAFQCNVWNIRNSATLLFGSLMTRIFGVSRTCDSEELSIKNRMAVHVFFIRYPCLYDYLLSKLQNGRNGNLSLYAILVLLIRLYPTYLEEESLLMVEKYLFHINKCLTCPIFKVRDFAARASLAFIPTNCIMKYVVKIILQLSNVKLSNNECHGLLLQLKYLLKSLAPNTYDVNIAKIIEPTFWIVICVDRCTSRLVVILYMEVIILISKIFLDNCYKALPFRKLFTLLCVLDNQQSKSVQIKKFNVYKVFIKFQLYVNILGKNYPAFYICEEIISNIFSSDVEIVEFCLSFIYSLNYKECEKPHRMENLNCLKNVYELVSIFQPEIMKSLLHNIHDYVKLYLIRNLKTIERSKSLTLLLIFQVLYCYPCILFNLRDTTKRAFINDILTYTDDNSADTGVIISCLSNIFYISDVSVLKRLNLKKVIQILTQSSSPVVMEHQRLAVCDFLVLNKKLICTKETCFNEQQLLDIWYIIIFLLEDNNQVIRNKISELCTSNDEVQNTIKIGLKMIPEMARNNLFCTSVNILSNDAAISFLLSWVTRQTDYCESNKFSEVFDKAELNLYYETFVVGEIAMKLLKEILWSSDNLHCKDKSRDFKKQTLVVTTLLINSLVFYPPILMSNKIKLLSLEALKSIKYYCEGTSEDMMNFSNFLQNTLNKFICKMITENDTSFMKRLFHNLYEPVLNV